MSGIIHHPVGKGWLDFECYHPFFTPWFEAKCNFRISRFPSMRPRLVIDPFRKYHFIYAKFLRQSMQFIMIFYETFNHAFLVPLLHRQLYTSLKLGHLHSNFRRIEAENYPSITQNTYRKSNTEEKF